MTRAVRRADETIARVREIGIIPVLRGNHEDVVVRAAHALIEAGLTAIEVTMTVPNAIDAIATLVRDAAGSHSRAVIGAGTVVDAVGAQSAIGAGADFIVSPGLVPEVIDVAKAAGVAVLPGALTPTEILAAVRAGADLIKIFPAQAMGGSSYIRALRGPFPDLLLVPTGGVDLNNVADFIRAGATAVGVGSELVSRDLLAREDWNALGVRAEQYLAAVATARGQAPRSASARV
jgi:2-dehydro-3-deoxyphosphogluconate aldolase / (4S)-4-hydroxy-2-oxoglutarate aldolase